MAHLTTNSPVSRFFAFIYDPLIAKTETACLKGWRKELLQQAYGVVLEVGAGTGANLAYYPDKVDELIISEPDGFMRKKLIEKLRNIENKNTNIKEFCMEDIDLADESVDCVVSTLVCCSVNDPQKSLQQAYRVLRPGGKFLFMEHIAAENNPKRLKWQNRINPIWKRISGNCHTNRETEKTILQAGFKIKQIEKASMRKAPAFVRPTIRGMAIKPK
jgi:ubiquinone/menaquinone biosynthesis C-methylase UbiE